MTRAARIPGVPFDQGRHPQGIFRAGEPSAGVLHRTYGRYAGDYSVGKNGRDGVGIGFPVLIGKNEGQWVQFYNLNVMTAHAKGANSWAFGIEFEGKNEEPLTAWQLRAGAWCIAFMSSEFGIPLDYYSTGARRRVHGWLPHSLVPGSTHTDLITRDDWNRMAEYWSGARPATPPPAGTPVPIDYAAVRRWAAGITLSSLTGIPNLDGSATKEQALAVVVLQQALNLVSGAGIAENGIYDDTTINAVWAFQRFINSLQPGAIKDFPGAAHEYTRWYLVTALQRIRDGAAT